MTASTSKHIAEVIDAACAAIDADPANARVAFSATGTAHGTVGSTVRVGKYRLEVDEPPEAGGGGTAPSPLQYHLTALVGCTIVTWRFWAEKLGVEVDTITARAEGDFDMRGFLGLDDAVRPGFGEVRVVVSVTGPASTERYREVQEAVEAHCAVHDITCTATPVRTSLEVR